MTEETVDLEIRFKTRDKDSGFYNVEAVINGGAQFEDEVQLEIEKLLANGFDSDKYGTALANALFSGQILRAFYKAEPSSGNQLRIRLRIDNEVGELHVIPWERIYHPDENKPLAISGETPFSRYIALPAEEGDTLTEGPVRLLFAIANPYNLPEGFAPIDVEEEIQNLRKIVAELGSGKIQVTLMPGRTKLSALTQRDLERDGIEVLEKHTTENDLITEMGKHHIIHFLGHGAFKKREQGTAFLYLEDKDGAYSPVTDDVLNRKVGALRHRPHLIFLAACESATRLDTGDPGHPFVGLGPKLVQAKIPAVVAMQDRVAMDLARQLTLDFYRELLDHGRVDEALNQARNLLFSSQDVDWSIPVLFMRLGDGRLFAIEDASPVSGSGGARAVAPDNGKANERVLVPPDKVDTVKLHGAMADSFNAADLEQLSFKLRVDYEDLGGSTKSGKARELIQYLERRGRLQELLDKLTAERSNVDWYGMTKD